eukprot:180931_1
MTTEHKEQEYRNDYIPVYDSNSMSYQQFVQHHLLKNEPCIIKNIVSNHNSNHKHNKPIKTWPIYNKWLNNNKNDIDYNYLSNTYGAIQVEVAQCGQLYGDEERASMSFRKYLKFLKQSKLKTNTNKHTQQLNKWVEGVKQYKISKFNPQWTTNILYCKDWHIVGALTPENKITPAKRNRTEMKNDNYNLDKNNSF